MTATAESIQIEEPVLIPLTRKNTDEFARKESIKGTKSLQE